MGRRQPRRHGHQESERGGRRRPPVRPVGDSKALLRQRRRAARRDLEFDAGASIEIESLFEQCTIALGDDADLVIGKAGVLAGCQIRGAGRIRSTEARRRESPGIQGPRSSSSARKIDNDRYERLTLAQVTRLEYLYQRAASALARLSTFSAEPNTTQFLESLVARAYAECHPNRVAAERFRPWHWFSRTFPQTFRKHSRAFALSVGLTLVGVAFGWGVVASGSSAKSIIMPGQFGNLLGSPAERVKQEESAKTDRLRGHKETFSAQLMTNNIRV